jgi:hypothetical protein
MYVFIVYESVFIQVFTFVQLIYTLECWSVLRSIRYKNKKNKKQSGTRNQGTQYGTRMLQYRIPDSKAQL